MFILNPDPYLLPSYRISPFSTSDVSFNYGLPDNDQIDYYLSKRFEGVKYYYTLNGRAALSIALSYYNLAEEDIVTIFTTSGNHYISQCVTDVINNFCGWSREIQDKTKVILINHEFGYPFNGLLELKKTGLPIIEDCAHSFFSTDRYNSIGRTGDFIIYSFPKIFPVQVGGLIVSTRYDIGKNVDNLSSGLLQYIKNVLSEHISTKDEIVSRRIFNYQELKSRFEDMDMPERFRLTDFIVPGVFMFRTDKYNFDLTDLRKHFWAHGIQSSVFYGEKAFFIPVHQKLQESDLDYFYEVMKTFIKKR